MKQNTWHMLAKAALETLEGRDMMSASMASVTLQDGVLQLTADSSAPAAMTVDFGANHLQLQAHSGSVWKSFAINQVQQIVITGGAEADNVYVNPKLGVPATISTGNGNDMVRGGGNDSIVAGNGNDWIKVVGGDNSVAVGSGKDVIELTHNYDVVEAGAGSDFIEGNGGHALVQNAGPGTLVTGARHVTVQKAVAAPAVAIAPVAVATPTTTGSSVVETPAAPTGGSTTPVSTPAPTSTSTPVAGSPTAVITLLAGTRQTGLVVNADGLSSTLGKGEITQGTFAWDFGDAIGAHNSFDGFSGGHVYDTPGTYTISLTVTNVDGLSSTATQQVTIAASARKVIYVDATNGSDANAGTLDAPLKSFTEAMTKLADNTEILFKAGETYTVTATANINNSNVLIGSYGEGANPLLNRATGDGISTFTLSGNVNGVTIEHLTFDCPWAAVAENAQAPKIGNSGIYLGGSNDTVRDCTFLNLDDAVNENKEPTGTLIEDNTAPLDTGVRGYFVWTEGKEQTIVGNFVANSTREHCIRASTWTDVTVTDNTLSNLNRQSVDPYDFSKGCIELHEGSYGYVTDNNCTGGDIRTGPLGLWGEATTDVTSNVIIEDNQLTGTYVFVQAGSQHINISNNVILSDSSADIEVAGPSGAFTSSDLTINNNTGVSNGTTGNFIYMQGAVAGIIMDNNLWIAPNIKPGAYGTAAVRVNQVDLSSFTEIKNNVWPTGKNGYGYANGGDITLGLPGDGYLTDAQWLAYSNVSGDTFQDVSLTDLNSVYQLNINGHMVGAAVKLAA